MPSDEHLDRRLAEVKLPPRIFLYTLDQVSFVLAIPMETLRRSYLHYHGRSIGKHKPGLLLARNIAPDGQPNDWRVAENELVRWMKAKGFTFQSSGRLLS